jgi:hypothetical protein
MSENPRVPIQSTPPALENAMINTITTDGACPSFKFSSQETAGVRRKLINSANANGIRTSLPRYSAAIAITVVRSGTAGDESEPRFEPGVTTLPNSVLI